MNYEELFAKIVPVDTKLQKRSAIEVELTIVRAEAHSFNQYNESAELVLQMFIGTHTMHFGRPARQYKSFQSILAL